MEQSKWEFWQFKLFLAISFTWEIYNKTCGVLVNLCVLIYSILNLIFVSFVLIAFLCEVPITKVRELDPKSLIIVIVVAFVRIMTKRRCYLMRYIPNRRHRSHSDYTRKCWGSFGPMISVNVVCSWEVEVLQRAKVIIVFWLQANLLIINAACVIKACNRAIDCLIHGSRTSLIEIPVCIGGLGPACETVAVEAVFGPSD